MKNFLTRTLTGFILITIVVGSIFLHPISFAMLFLAIPIGMYIELKRMLAKNSDYKINNLGLVSSVVIYLISFLSVTGLIDTKFLFLIILILPLLLANELFSRNNKSLHRIANTLFANIYTFLPFILMLFASFGSIGHNSILGHNLGLFNPGIVLGFFILIWINDSGAYIVGITLGKHKLAENISPKKTWEGFIGGLAFTVLFAYPLSKYLAFFTTSNWLIIAAICCLGSTLGDLFESHIKRQSGIKDSGTFLPGHGGILDRFDGVTIAFPLVFVYQSIFG